MLNTNKKPNEARPGDQKSKDQPPAVANKDAAANARDNKEIAQEKSAMRSEGGKN